MSQPKKPQTTPRPTRPKAPHATPLATRADRSVSEAAQASGDDGTTQSSDWMAERTQPAAPAPGVSISGPKQDTSGRGNAKESRRGSY